MRSAAARIMASSEAMSTVSVAIDCMGGDTGPGVTVPAAIEFLRSHAQARVILVGQPEALQPYVDPVATGFGERLCVHPASEVIAMDEAPATAMRNKKDSSMRVAINLVKSGDAQAVVSAGNTGALMAISRFVLKTLPGIDRPAICSVLPSMKGRVYILDLGANVDCTPEHLLQFGVMGAMYASAVEHLERPTVGLLNIGEEAIKGNDVVKQAAELLRNSGLNFFGNVEGDDIYAGTTDIVVCDGFVGNVALKTTEGLAQMLSGFLKEEFTRSLPSKLMGLMALPVLKRFKKRSDHRLYNGAALVGLRGVVIKSHGSADVFGYGKAIERAAEAAANNLVERIVGQMAKSQPHEHREQEAVQ